MYRSRRGVRRTGQRGSGRHERPGRAPKPVMRETLQVLSVSDGQMQVNGARGHGCMACALKSGCVAGTLKPRSGPDQVRLTLPRVEGVAPGDTVSVEWPAGTFVTAAALAFLLPPLALVAAVLIGTGLGLSPVPQALSCAVAFGLSLVPLWLRDRRGKLLADLRAVRGAPE